MIEGFLVRQVGILRAPLLASEFNDSIRDWDSATIVSTTNGWVPPEIQFYEINKDREHYYDEIRLYLLPNVDLLYTDRCIMEEDTYQVLGRPSKAFTPLGNHHLEVRLRVIQG